MKKVIDVIKGIGGTSILGRKSPEMSPYGTEGKAASNT